MTVLRGNAGFMYTPDGGVEITVPLSAPLWFAEPREVKTRVTHQPLDRSQAPVVVTLGSGAWEVEARMRYQSDAHDVLTMLSDAADGVTITYYPDLSDLLTSYPFRLMGVGDEVALAPDSKFGHWQYRYERTLRLHLISGTLERLIDG